MSFNVVFFCLVSSIHSLFITLPCTKLTLITISRMTKGNKLCIGELQYVSKKQKQACLSFVDYVPARDVKSALSLVVRLLLEHSNVPEEKSFIVDLLMIDIKKSLNYKTIHANS